MIEFTVERSQVSFYSDFFFESKWYGVKLFHVFLMLEEEVFASWRSLHQRRSLPQKRSLSQRRPAYFSGKAFILKGGLSLKSFFQKEKVFPSKKGLSFKKKRSFFQKKKVFPSKKKVFPSKNVYLKRGAFSKEVLPFLSNYILNSILGK